jgi:hypothetical protein
VEAVDKATQAGGDVDEAKLFLLALLEKVFAQLFIGTEVTTTPIGVKSVTTTRDNKPQ